MKMYNHGVGTILRLRGPGIRDVAPCMHRESVSLRMQGICIGIQRNKTHEFPFEIHFFWTCLRTVTVTVTVTVTRVQAAVSKGGGFGALLGGDEVSVRGRAFGHVLY